MPLNYQPSSTWKAMDYGLLDYGQKGLGQIVVSGSARPAPVRSTC